VAAVQPEASFEVVASVAAAAHRPEPQESSQRERESVQAPMEEAELQEQESNLASALKQSRQRIESAPQKKGNPWSALAPQCLLLNCRFQCNRGGPQVTVANQRLPKSRILLSRRNPSPQPIACTL